MRYLRPVIFVSFLQQLVSVLEYMIYKVSVSLHNWGTLTLNTLLTLTSQQEFAGGEKYSKITYIYKIQTIKILGI